MITKEMHSKRPTIAFEIGQVAAAAALAHDIGNPPFGHIGEKAIGNWFKHHASNKLVSKLTPSEMIDFVSFEGNAQGFRILTRLAHAGGGLRLTAATVGAFTKYPTASNKTSRNYIGSKKHGFFKADAKIFEATATALGLKRRGPGRWSRHPLAFLVEAADDICYRIIDVEDGVKLGRISMRDAEECLVQMLPVDVQYDPTSDTQEANLGWLRAKAIGGLISAAQSSFLDAERAILQGNHTFALLDSVKMSTAIDRAKSLVSDNVYNWDRTIMAEIAGAKILEALLQDFMEAASEPDRGINGKMLQMIQGFPVKSGAYEKIITITDYISGMTDSFLLRLYRQLHGHSLLG